MNTLDFRIFLPAHRWLFTLGHLLFASALLGQNCPCLPAFTFVQAKTELNYAGFADKVTTTTRAEYEAHTASLRAQADTMQQPKDCAKLCNQWLAWFKDKHLRISANLIFGARRPDTDFSLSVLDSQTLLFKLPSMDGYYKPLIDSVLKRNNTLLAQYPHLIIDCRGNGGGDTYTWNNLMPYLCTGPTVTDGMLFRASKDNEKAVLSWSKTAKTKYSKKYYRKQLSEMKKKPGTFVGTMNAWRAQCKKVMPKPQKVVILTNERCASSCEMFVLWAQQSQKVTIMGGNTAGIVDYGAVQNQTIPCHNWLFAYPIARSNRVPDGRSLDNVGIAPKICLDDQTADWVDYARIWLKGGN